MAAIATACRSPAPPACERSLDGVWRTGERIDGEDVGWHFLERNGAIEGYPTYRDVPADLPPGIRAAPSVIDLVRADGVLAGGRWSRRFELGGERCAIAAPVHVTRCAGGELILELGAITPPTDWSACKQPDDAAAFARQPIAPPLILRLQR